MMNFFKVKEPLLRFKQPELDVQDLCGLLRLKWQIGAFKLRSNFYTRIDQAFALWGIISIIIFATAQFLPINWTTQAWWWSILTMVGIVLTIVLTDFWAKVERLLWVVYLWVGLMILALAITDLAIFQGWPAILINLCPLWLGITAIGYLGTGIGLQSRILFIIGIVQLLGIVILPYLISWQFLITGTIMGGSLLILAEFQWDMRPPIIEARLTEEQKQFNLKQYNLRRSNRS
ncbi:MAG: hypothetical protein ACFBSE_17420 [Prochloraceae cyanobacterium]